MKRDDSFSPSALKELARQLGTTVDHLNAINELELQPSTLLMRDSELYFTREPMI